MEDPTDDFTIDEILKRLSAPVTEPSILATNAPSDTTPPQVHGTSIAPAKKGGGNHASRRIYTDEEKLERRRNTQQAQRERRRQEETEIQKQITETATALEVARSEQDYLLAENTTLRKIGDYCTAAWEAAHSVVYSSLGKVQAQYQTAMDGLWWLGSQMYSLSDAQLHAYLDSKTLEEFDTISEKAMQRSVQLVFQWEEEPAARARIEAQLESVLVKRLRCLTYLARTRPIIVVNVVSRRIMPTGPDGAPNPKLVEAVAALNLTSEQLESLEQEWTLYLQNTGPLRQEVRSIISFLTSSAAEENLASFSIGAAGLFMDRLQAVQELELHPSNEARVLSGLISWIPSNLTMQQKVCLVRHCVPHFPDIIQIGRILFGDKYSTAIVNHPDRIESMDI